MNIGVTMGIIELTFNDYRSASLAFSLFILCSFSSVAQPTPWELKIDKNGIQIFSRWKDGLQGDDKVREIKATFTVSAIPQKLIGILQDPDKATDWMVGAKSFSVLDFHSPKSWYTYTEFALPWPFQNQDLVAHYRVESGEGQTTQVKVEALPSYHPEYPKIERLQHFEACWTFRLLGNGRTEVNYWAFTHKKPSAPRWVAAPIVQNSLWKTMSDFRTLAER